MRFLLLIFILWGNVAWAQLRSEKSVSEELNVTSAEEAKPYLLFAAALESLDQFEKELGFDGKEFRKSLDEKFQKYFDAYKERQLKDRFGKNYSATLGKEQKEEFLKGLESHRKSEFMKFSRVNETVDRHEFKKLENDPNNIRVWRATIGLEFNRVNLDRLIKRTLSVEEKQYSRIILMSEITPINFTWQDLGLEKEEIFSAPLLNSWSKWFNSNLPSNVEEIYLCDENCKREFLRWQEIPQDEGMKISPDLINTLWLRVSFHLRRVRFVPSLNEWEFEISGAAVLLDANTKRVLATKVLSPETKTWRGLDQKALNSALASQMYRSPLSAFQSFSRRIVDLPQLNRVDRLVIKGHKNLEEVLSLMELLKKEGRSIHLDLKLDRFTPNEAQLLSFYQGEEKSFSDLLSRPKELESSQSYRLVNEFTGVHHVLKLVHE